MKDSEGNDEAGRKQKRTTTGSQTDEDSSKHLVETLEEINHKLGVALARIKEIQGKQKELECITEREREICPQFNQRNN